MRRVPVLVAGWEIECCRPQPAVGDQVSWSLVFHDECPAPDAALDPAARARQVDLDVDVEPLGGPRCAPGAARDARPEFVSIVRSGSLSALRRLLRPAYGAEHVHGVLRSDTHTEVLPDELVPTRGQVERVQVVSRRFRPARGGRCWVPDTGWSGLREVQRSPRWFGTPGDGTPGGEGPRVRETAVLVTLRVA